MMHMVLFIVYIQVFTSAGLEKRFWTKPGFCGWLPLGEPCYEKKAEVMVAPLALKAWREKVSNMKRVLSSLEKRHYTRPGSCGFLPPGEPCYKMDRGDMLPTFPEDSEPRKFLAKVVRQVDMDDI